MSQSPGSGSKFNEFGSTTLLLTDLIVQAAGGAEEEAGQPAEGQAGHCRPHQQGPCPATSQQEEVSLT